MASNDTYAGSLEVLAKQLAGMSLLADANLPFVMDMLTQVQDEMRSPEMAMQRAGVLPAGPANPQGNEALGLPGGMPPMPGDPMGGMGMPAPPPSGLGAGMPGGPPTAPAPDPAMVAALMGGG